MDENGKKTQTLHTEQGNCLKPYEQPKLTPLGSIHSLIKTAPGVGTDGGSGMNSALS